MLLLLIGLDLAQVSISRSWLAPRVLLIPCLVMVGSMIAGVLISLVTGEQLAVALALSTGFGWFSLSGALAGQYLGDAYGSAALLNDLMRELIGLSVVFYWDVTMPTAVLACVVQPRWILRCLLYAKPAITNMCRQQSSVV